MTFDDRFVCMTQDWSPIRNERSASCSVGRGHGRGRFQSHLLKVGIGNFKLGERPSSRGAMSLRLARAASVCQAAAAVRAQPEGQ